MNASLSVFVLQKRKKERTWDKQVHVIRDNSAWSVLFCSLFKIIPADWCFRGKNSCCVSVGLTNLCVTFFVVVCFQSALKGWICTLLRIQLRFVKPYLSLIYNSPTTKAWEPVIANMFFSPQKTPPQLFSASVQNQLYIQLTKPSLGCGLYYEGSRGKSEMLLFERDKIFYCSVTPIICEP